MGGAVGDYDNDGHIDIFLTGRRGEDFTAESTLYRNDGAGGFIDVTAESGDLATDDISGIHWGNAFFDYDNDGDLDLYVTSENLTEINTNSLYENAGDGTHSRGIRARPAAPRRSATTTATARWMSTHHRACSDPGGSEPSTKTWWANKGIGSSCGCAA
jgi:hypothetical protein